MSKTLDFMSALWALDHGLQVVSKRMEANLGITGPQRLVVRVVGRQPGISAGELARRLHTHPSTLTGVLRRLEERGALQREADPEDGRRAVFFLTETGRELDRLRSGTVEAAVRRGLARLTPEQRETMRAGLGVLVEELNRSD
jgi:DNA-binding MarR family transcriptional regulator